MVEKIEGLELAFGGPFYVLIWDEFSFPLFENRILVHSQSIRLISLRRISVHNHRLNEVTFQAVSNLSLSL
jgi:hypothetical protein